MTSYKSTFNNSPRSSPFRRPGSPGSPTLVNGGRPATPPTNRSAASPLTSPSKLKHAYTVSEEEEDEIVLLLLLLLLKQLRYHSSPDLAPTLPPDSVKLPSSIC
ncbi:hypothetical protein CLAIMM_00454 [Cladophialophora immunda]|nr:hypothetical protein CLAIMM_00454 [Cladophialophora immunda]